MSKIKIDYTWGDKEIPVKIPENTKDKYMFMVDLALKELRIELEEYCGEGVCHIEANEEGINLTYQDGEICRYEIVDDDYEPDMEEEKDKSSSDDWWEKDYGNQ